MKALTFAEIEEVFQSWRQQVENDETAMLLWNQLFNDLRMKAESSEGAGSAEPTK